MIISRKRSDNCEVKLSEFEIMISKIKKIQSTFKIPLIIIIVIGLQTFDSDH